MKEFSLKMIEKSKEIVNEKLDLTPIEIPFDDELPKTHHESIARILFASGQISMEQYLSMSGIRYSYTDDEADDDFEDDFDDLDFIDLDTQYTKEPSSFSLGVSNSPETLGSGDTASSASADGVSEAKATPEPPSTTEAS